MKKIILLSLVAATFLNINLFAVRIYSASDIGAFRPAQEDVVVIDETQPNRLYAGIFDGHGGDSVALALRDILLQRIMEHNFSENMAECQILDALTSSFLLTNREIFDSVCNANIESSGAQFVQARCNVPDPGSTAIISLILKDHIQDQETNQLKERNRLVVANVGDCRAVLCKSGQAIRITTDHKASDSEEIKRIESLGGAVFYFQGMFRVLGVLAVSRAFGDKGMCVKGADGVVTLLVEPKPDVFVRPIEVDDEFLIIASDGLWDKVKDHIAVDCVKASGGPSKATCEHLIKVALDLGSRDNVSVVIIDFKH